MLCPLKSGRGPQARTQLMLAAGGRVVGVEHEPDHADRLMLPTENELKTLLYDQTCVRAAAYKDRENIDYVALNAFRRPRRGGNRKGFKRSFDSHRSMLAFMKCDNPPGSAKPEAHTSGAHRQVSGIRLFPQRKTRYDRSHRRFQVPISPEYDSEEEISQVLTSFSALGKAVARRPEAVAISTMSRLEREKPHRDMHSHANVDIAEATLEISKPLAKVEVDVYSILARASPQELGRGPCNQQGMELGRDSNGTKDGINNRRRGLRIRKKIKGNGVRRVLEAGPSHEVAYVPRDPLGDEVAELGAKIQADFARVEREAEGEQPSPGINFSPLAVMLAEKTKLVSPKGGGACTAATDGMSRVEGLRGGSLGSGTRRRCRQRRGRRIGQSKHGCCPVGRSLEEQVDESRKGIVLTGHILRGDLRGTMPLNGEENTGPTNASFDFYASDVRREVRLQEEKTTHRWEAAETRHGNEQVDVAQSNDATRCEGPGGSDTDATEYGEASFESTESMVSFEGSVAPSAACAQYVNGNESEQRNSESTRGVLSAREEGPSAGGAAVGLSETALARKIQSCWRGFLGRCATKHALRCTLLSALRNLGGGSISKVLALADLEDGDRKGLDRALSTAIQSQFPLRQLPPKAYLLDCARFVESTQRRRTKVVDARKKRWVIERNRRRYNERTNDLFRRSRTVARVEYNPCFAKERRKTIGAE